MKNHLLNVTNINNLPHVGEKLTPKLNVIPKKHNKERGFCICYCDLMLYFSQFVLFSCFLFYSEGTFCVEAVSAKYHIQKVTLLREFVTSVGIQLQLREYDFDAKTMFHESDILNMFPKVKHINPTASDAYNFYQSGQNKIQIGECCHKWKVVQIFRQKDGKRCLILVSQDEVKQFV